MAKKKNQSKKHKFKYTEPVTEATVVSGTLVSESIKEPNKALTGVKSTSAASKATVGTDRDFSYVGKDLRHIAILAVSLILFEFVLSYVFNHTGLGASVNNLIKL